MVQVMSTYSLRPVVKQAGLKDAYKIFIPKQLFASLKRDGSRDLWVLEDESGNVVAKGLLTQPAQNEVQGKVLQVTHEFREVFGLSFEAKYSLKRSEESLKQATKILLRMTSADDSRVYNLEERAFWRGALSLHLADKFLSPGFPIDDVEVEEKKASFKVTSISNTVESDLLQALDVHIVAKNCKIILDNSPHKDIHLKPFELDRTGIFGLDGQLNDIDDLLRAYSPARLHARGIRNGLLLSGPTGSDQEDITGRIAQLPWAKKIVLSKSDLGKSPETSLIKVFRENLSVQPCLIALGDLEVLTPNDGDSIDSALGKAMKILRNHRVLVVAHSENANGGRRQSANFKTVRLSMPEEATRCEILRDALEQTHEHATPGTISAVASITPGFTNEHLRTLVWLATSYAELRMNIVHELGPDSLFQSLDLNDALRLADFEEALKEFNPTRAKHGQAINYKKVYWSDIGGQAETKELVEQLFEWPLRYPDRFKALGLRPGKGLLLYGPPGCSKTMTALALKTEAKLNFISIKGPELLSKYVGESEHNLRKIFAEARNCAPCVLFFDEIDSIASTSNSSGNNNNGGLSLVSTLLNELDGVEELTGVSILAATNKPWDIDQALLRPGRFDGLVYVKLPDKAARTEILRIELNRMAHEAVDHGALDIETLSAATEGCSGAEVADLCRQAAYLALKETIKLEALAPKETINMKGPESKVSQAHFEAALQTLRRSTDLEALARFEDFANSQK